MQQHLQEEVSMKTGVIEEIMRRMDKLSNNLDEGIKAKGHLTIKKLGGGGWVAEVVKRVGR